MERLVIPKVKFKVAKVKDFINLVNDFLNPKTGDWDWSHYIYKRYPELRRKLFRIKDKKRRKEIARKFFERIQKKEFKKLEKAKEAFQKSWNKINDDVMVVLSEVVEQRWPEKFVTINARVSLCPINPRYIKSRTFDVYYKVSLRYMKDIAIHEILHFIYFEKWKKVFPKTPEKKFDAPYLIWDLSELVTSVVLSDERIQKVLKHKPHPYKEHKEMKVNGKCVLTYLMKYYKKRKSFENFMRKSWQFVKKHKKEVGGKE